MKFSVIVPVYNCSEYLCDCANSVLRQSGADFELLLVDDGSTDGSGALCDRLAAEDKRIRVFHKANGGASSARNVGLAQASGDYVLFLDGDDTIEPDLLKSVTDILVSDNVQMAVFGMAFDYYGPDGKLLRTEPKAAGRRGTVAREAFLSEYRELFFDNSLSSACNKVFSASLIRENHLCFSEQMILYEDLDFVLKTLPYCDQIAFLDRTYYHYRIIKEQDHFARRVNNLNTLHCNLDELAASALTLHSKTAARVTVNLCAQLYDRFLLMIPQSKKEAEEAKNSILASPALERLGREGFFPDESSSASWALLTNKQSTELWGSIVKRRIVRKIKRLAKQTMRRIGLERKE